MKTVSCCFILFLVPTSPTTPVIYSLKFVIAFIFWAFIFSHTVAVTENESLLGLGFDSWRMMLLKIGPDSKGS